MTGECGNGSAAAADPVAHDPLCGCLRAEECYPTADGQCVSCMCYYIAKVRADEREQMKGQMWCHRCDKRMRVEWGTDKITGDTVATGYCSGCSYGFLMLMDEYVSAAARGEEP